MQNVHQQPPIQFNWRNVLEKIFFSSSNEDNVMDAGDHDRSWTILNYQGNYVQARFNFSD